MPRFQILPIDQSYSSAEVVALDAASVLHMVQRLDCGEADVMRDGAYCFSVRLQEKGLWCIFQRDGAASTDEVQAFG